MLIKVESNVLNTTSCLILPPASDCVRFDYIYMINSKGLSKDAETSLRTQGHHLESGKWNWQKIFPFLPLVASSAKLNKDQPKQSKQLLLAYGN